MNPVLRDVIITGLLGMLIHMFIKARDLKKSSTAHNIEFKFSEYILGDWLSHILSLLVFVLYLFLINRRLGMVTTHLYEVLLVTSATVGYSGDHLASKFFSATTKKMEEAISYKTRGMDKASDTENKPTPK